MGVPSRRWSTTYPRPVRFTWSCVCFVALWRLQAIEEFSGSVVPASNHSIT
jgi:hypothetical protein